MLGEDLGERRPVGRVVRAERHDGRVRVPASRTRPSGRSPGESRRAIASTTRVGVGAGPVDLVDEDQRRDVEPLERAEQERRLRLDALDRRDDEDRAVEHAEDALDLGDEVGVAGRVDEVDREVADEERGDRGPDRDAAFALEVERVGLGGAGVDAADVVDGAGGEEESLGEGGLTGVDVGEDSEIERAHGASCLARRWSPSGWTWVLPCRSFLAARTRGCRRTGSHGASSARPYDAAMRNLPTILLVLSLPAGLIGWFVGSAVVNAILPGNTGVLALFVPLLVAGLCMMPFLIPYLDRKAKADLAAHRREEAETRATPRQRHRPRSERRRARPGRAPA